MPEQKSSRMFPKVLLLLLIATVIAAASIFLSPQGEPAPVMEGDQNTPVTEPEEEATIVGPITAPADIVEMPPTDVVPAEAPVLSESVEAQIRAINAKVDAGELTRETAQRLINELLGI